MYPYSPDSWARPRVETGRHPSRGLLRPRRAPGRATSCDSTRVWREARARRTRGDPMARARSETTPLPRVGMRRRPSPAASSFTQVAAEYNHTCGLASEGTAYGWGSNTEGELGGNATTRRDVPAAAVAIYGETDTRQTAVEYEHKAPRHSYAVIQSRSGPGSSSAPPLPAEPNFGAVNHPKDVVRGGFAPIASSPRTIVDGCASVG